jgi:hypothetical protein
MVRGIGIVDIECIYFPTTIDQHNLVEFSDVDIGLICNHFF